MPEPYLSVLQDTIDLMINYQNENIAAIIENPLNTKTLLLGRYLK